MKAHTIYAVKVDTVGAADVLIDQVSDFAVNPAANRMLVAADGAVDPTFVALAGGEPRLAFSSSAIATVLGTIGIAGLAITADADEAGLEAWFQQYDEGATRTAGATHQKLTIKEGLLLPRTITAAGGLSPPPAVMSLEAIATYDGTNLPIVVAAADAALLGTPTVDEIFVAGPVMINGVQLEGVQNITINFGIVELVLGADGSVWPTFAAVQGRAPSITIETLDALALRTFGLAGAAQGATDSIVYLRKVTQNVTREADDASNHISFTIDEGMISVDSSSGSHGGGPVTSSVTITPTSDGTNAILAISTAADIV